MNKFLISSFKQTFFVSNKLYSIKYCNFARSTQKPSINKLINKLSDKPLNSLDNILDINNINSIPDDIKQQFSKISQNENLENMDNLSISNLDHIIGKKDENFTQKNKHRAASSKNSEAKEEDDSDVTISKE